MPFSTSQKGRPVIPTFIFFKWANTDLFYIYFVFSNTLQILQHQFEKCPSSIRCQDSNSQPLELESPPITTRPGLPAKFIILPCQWYFSRALRRLQTSFAATSKCGSWLRLSPERWRSELLPRHPRLSTSSGSTPCGECRHLENIIFLVIFLNEKLGHFT